ncbi:hypothetical protein [Fictibacillus terranigra]|uniref:Uncharacterized protein n=1 Tax=Fictibacillus terranigra TaxID=3058424 RepID=A0ABT8EAE4_9BACL|nr:hypothetical protein [Fictibacillus sp. CENA-BCM004]MDN4074897.1 hypothetical protein [Fictibacillus sp. CENA-BCM004]
MIKNKRLLYISFAFMVVSMALNFPFPNASPYGNTNILGRSVETVNGINVIGMISLGLLMVGLYFLVTSLNQYHARLVVLAIVMAIFLPHILADSFQKHFATGIYAISYNSDKGDCTFEMANKTTLHAVCKLPMKNYSHKDVRFTVALREKYGDKDDMKPVTLVNANAPYNAMLRGKENKTIIIEREIDVSHIKDHIEGGELSPGIIITSGKYKRQL